MDRTSTLLKKSIEDKDHLRAWIEKKDTTEFSAEAVRLIDVQKHYYTGEVLVQALSGINLTIYKGEYISIMGPSGSGKSTLFNMIGGLDKPTKGKVFVDDVDISELDPFELAWLRCRKIGYIFQTFNLIGVMNALENVMLPVIFSGTAHEIAQNRAVDFLTLVKLEDRLKHKPLELSGGQQQRVAIARAFTNHPTIILADEPTGNLDLITGREIIDLLKTLNKENGVTVITATHDYKMLDVSDRIIWLVDGKIDKIEERKNLKINVGSI